MQHDIRRYGRRDAMRLRKLIRAGMEEWEARRDRGPAQEPPRRTSGIIPKSDVRAHWFTMSLHVAVCGPSCAHVRLHLPVSAHDQLLS